jgi:SAM-dependent methyltransferase
MRCPRCLKDVQESVKRCQCGFSFDDVASSELPSWFAEVKQVLETAYTTASTPWQQSGKSGTFEDWMRLRLPNLSPVSNSGTYLDIGCANGYLLECILIWAKLKGVEIVPYGLDYSAQLITLAQKRLLKYVNNFYVGNVWNWFPPQRFDYVRTELEYVPRNYYKPLIERLMTEFLTEDGKLILSQYRSRRDDLTQGWIDSVLARWDFKITAMYSGYSGDGLELCRVAVLQA